MQKTKKIQKIITILVLIYLIISFGKNFMNNCKRANLKELYNCSTGELREIYEEAYNKMSLEEKQKLGNKTVEELTDQELEIINKNNIRSNLLTIAILSLCVTFMENIMIIVIYVAVKIANGRLKMEKLGKEDFYKSKQYYREILDQERNMCIIVD